MLRCIILVGLMVGSVACSKSRLAPASARNEGGVCCPISDFRGCSPGNFGGVPAGGWAATAAECENHIASSFDGAPFEEFEDAHGCPVLEARGEWTCGRVPGDAGI